MGEVIIGHADGIDQTQKQLRQKGIALGAELGINVLCVSLKNIPTIFKIVLAVLKPFITLVLRDEASIVKMVAVMVKMTWIFSILGFCLDPIIDTVCCFITF